MKDFSYVLINGADRSEAARYYIDESYRLWHEVWSQAILELEGTDKIPSDDFTRHEEIGVVFHKDRAIGSISFSSVDLSSPMWQRDSYFKVWPESLLLQLAKRYRGTCVKIGCYFTVHKDWRRDSQGFSVKQLVLGLAIEHVIQSGFRAMVGTMRVNRGMDKLAYDFGAESLLRGVKHHGVDVDLLVWDSEYISKNAAGRPFVRESKEIYSRRVIPSLLATLDEKSNAA